MLLLLLFQMPSFIYPLKQKVYSATRREIGVGIFSYSHHPDLKRDVENFFLCVWYHFGSHRQQALLYIIYSFTIKEKKKRTKSQISKTSRNSEFVEKPHRCYLKVRSGSQQSTQRKAWTTSKTNQPSKSTCSVYQ